MIADWQNYSMPVENDDILTVLTEAGIARAVIIGTSRGGLHAMMLSETRPSVLAAVVLNDIGAVFEPRGMARIRSYVGKVCGAELRGRSRRAAKKADGRALHRASTRRIGRLTPG